MKIDDPAKTLERINAVFTGGAVPHNHALGLRAVDVGESWVVLELPYAEHLVGDPDSGVLHGGAITAQLDAASGLAVFLALENPTRVATIDLRIDYLAAATVGRPVLGRAECYKLTRNVGFARALAYHDDPEDPIAAAAGTFMIFGEAMTTVMGIRKP